jgi:predicted nucleic acid-binding protein
VIAELGEAFGLTPFERRALLLLAAVETDDRLAELCGGALTVGALMSLLPDADWPALSPARPLRRWRLVELSGGPLLSARTVRIAEPVLHHLAGVDAPEPRIDPALRPCRPEHAVAASHAELAMTIASQWEPADDGWPVVQLHGPDPDGCEDVATIVAAELGWRLHAVRAADLPATPADREAFAALWARESILRTSALLVEAPEGGEDATARFADAVEAPVLVSAPEPLTLRRPSRDFSVARPAERERRALWEHALGTNGRQLEALGRVAVSARAIAAAAPAVRAAADPLAVVRAGRSTRLDGLAVRVAPAASWSDLVVPEDVLDSLRSIAAQVRHRETVYDDWGFAAGGGRGLGITALFSGESGTGKTMAAEVLANELSLDLYVIDLSAVVSKYIGETEKNLARVFDAAEDGAILLFDEADALFGKRTEVRDSHDRYANMEVSYLLQRMEAYRGLAILTTNLKTALDRAFQRRLRFVVSFPFPDAALRERIWRGVFPADTPVSRLNWPRLPALSLAGGSIRNVAINAAFHAADDGGTVRMAHVLRAARSEYAKLERPLAAELRR